MKSKLIREKEFMQTVRELAEWKGWKYYHTWNSIRSPAGFPDLVLVKPPRVIFAELKINRRRISPHQQEWLDSLKACPAVETYLWTPEDFEEIQKVL